MKKTTGLMAGASRFAHFAGLSRSTARRRAAEDDQDEPKGKRGRASENDDDDHEDEDDQAEPKGKRGQASEDDEDGDEPKGKRGRASEDDDDDEPKGKRGRASEDDDDGEPKGKRSRRASDDDDDDTDAEDDEDELNGKSSAACARRRERARISHILGHKAAANNQQLAVSLACTTRMSRHEAVRVLRGQAEREDDRPQRRQSRTERNVTVGSDAGPRGKAKTDAGWARAFGKAGVKVLDR